MKDRPFEHVVGLQSLMDAQTLSGYAGIQREIYAGTGYPLRCPIHHSNK